MAGFLTKEDELYFSTTLEERVRRKKHYDKNRERLLAKSQKNRDKKKEALSLESRSDANDNRSC